MKSEPGTTGRPWLTLLAAVLGGAMVGLDGTVTTIAAPYIAKAVGASLGQLELIANAYLVALALVLLPAGRLADRFGRRRTFVLGVGLFGAASLALALSHSVWALVIFRTVQGIAGALLQPSALAVLRNAFPVEKIGLPLGVWGGANALAIGLGPVIGGVIVQSLDWPAVFALNVPVAVLTIALTYFAVAESRGPAERTKGVVRALLAKRPVWLGAAMVAVSSFGVFGLLFLLTLYLQNVHEMPPVTAGAWMLAPTCVVVLSAPIGGVLAQRFGPRWPVAAGLALVAAGLTSLTLLDVDSTFTDLLYPGALVGAGTGLCTIAATEAIIGAVPDESTGTASALQQIASQLGGVLGVAGVGIVMSWQISTALPTRIAQARLPEPLGQHVESGREFLAQGLIPPGFDESSVGTAVAHAVSVLSKLTFLDGMGAALLVAACVSLLGAGAALFLPRPAAAASPEVPAAEPVSPATR